MASRIQNKRSSFKGKRPNNANLEPGEIALNTNADDAGLFFEANDGSVVKVGPTFIGNEPPETNGVEYWNGEQWYDQGNATLNFFSKIRDEWFPALSPLMGGAKTAIFVGSEFPEATDDLSNDGAARPFMTLNRACVEVARRSILRGRLDQPFNARFVIVLLPGLNVVQNEPGLETSDFVNTTRKFVLDETLTSIDLARFNPTTGGLLLPRGTSLIGFDLRKTRIAPTYYPAWSRSVYEASPSLIAPRTSVIKWTGNSYVTACTFQDKIEVSSVNAIEADPTLGEAAILTTLRPHGFRAATDGTLDEVTISYPENVSQVFDGKQSIPASGVYYAEPINATQFYLRKNTATGAIVVRDELPKDPSAGSSPAEFLNIGVALSTHHRLSSLSYATEDELNDFYVKVQHSFGDLNFGNTFSNAEVNSGETTIVAPTPADPTEDVDQVQNGSAYLFNVSLRSDYGMCGLLTDGAAVKGFKSALSCNFTAVSLQNDADVYEVYISTQERVGWFSLTEAAAFSAGVDPASVTNDEALDYLVSNVSLKNLRFYYRQADDVAVGTTEYSSGLTDDLSDTRHYNTLATNSAVCQIVSSFSIGTAVNYWSRNGGRITVSNSNSNFGGQALRAEGFSGIGTTGGSIPPNRGFTVQGVRVPRSITASELVNEKYHLQLFLNVGVTSLDETNHVINLTGQFDPSTIFPYTLKAGTAIWVANLTTGLRYSAILENFAGTTSPVSADGLSINLSETNDNITNLEVNNITSPYVRRFADPRTTAERTYYLWVQNTSQAHRPPQSSYILRYSEKPQSGTDSLVTPGRQLDPGQAGGWNQTFSVAAAMTKDDGDNPNIIPGQVIPSNRSSQGYYIGLRLCDSFGPWIGGDTTDPEIANRQYARGSFATTDEYNYFAANSEIQVGANAIDPSSQTPSSWKPSKPYVVGQPTGEAWIPSTLYPASADPWTDEYADNAVYMRGVGVEREAYFSIPVIDEDDGSANLGLQGTGDYANFANPELTDPPYLHSRLAVARFIQLLGYTAEGVDGLLMPRPQPSRTVEVGQLPWPEFQPNLGNAEAQGNWSVEFNTPSTVVATNHTWEWAGYLTYSKGLPEYQISPLSRRLRFDYVLSEAWGGMTIASGATESGEFVLSGFTLSGGDGLPTIGDEIPTIGNDGDFVLRAGDNMTGDLTFGVDP